MGTCKATKACAIAPPPTARGWDATAGVIVGTGPYHPHRRSGPRTQLSCYSANGSAIEVEQLHYSLRAISRSAVAGKRVFSSAAVP